MRSRLRKFSRAILFSSCVAIATPALAAGLVTGTAAAVKIVADANPVAGTEPAETSAGTPADQSATSTEPRRLSDLAGSDQRAWHSARDVHPRLSTRKPR